MTAPSADRREDYWRRTLVLTGVLLGIWFVVTYVVAFFAVPLNEIKFFGFPLGFYMAAQGSLIVYVVIIGYYARVMNRRDTEYGVHEDGED
jgi:putative solute:sodium symporter small subunit